MYRLGSGTLWSRVIGYKTVHCDDIGDPCSLCYDQKLKGFGAIFNIRKHSEFCWTYISNHKLGTRSARYGSAAISGRDQDYATVLWTSYFFL